MDFKKDFNLAFKPKTVSLIVDTNVKKGIKLMSAYFSIWLLIHVIIALINGIIDSQSLGGTFLFSLLTGLSVAVIGIIGLLLTGLVSAWSTKLFKGAGDLQKTIGLVSYAVVPIFIINVFRDLVLFISTIGNHFLATSFVYINTVLFIILFIWIAWLSTEAIALANVSTLTNLPIKKWQALVCFVIGFIVAALIAWPIRWVLVKIVTAILAGVL